MKLKLESKELIEFFETDVVTEKVLDEFDGYHNKTICIDVDFSNYLGYQVFNEIRRIQMYFPNLKNVGFYCFVKSGEDVKKVLDSLPTTITDFISFEGNLTGADFSSLSYFKNLSELTIIQKEKNKDISFPAINLPKKVEYLTLKNVKLPTQINTQDFSGNIKKEITLMINDVSQLSLKQLDEIERKYKINKIGIVRYPEENDKGIVIDSFYSAGEYRIIMEKLHELIKGIDADLPEDKKVIEIYKRVAENIDYDKETASKGKIPLESRNLKNALIYGEGVCVGYANVIKEACSLLGTEAIMVHGIVGKNTEHAWNKIKINGDWYNFDATYDHEYIIDGEKPEYMFRTDRFLKHDFLEERRKEISGPKCTSNFKFKSIISKIKKWFPIFSNTKKALPAGDNSDIIQYSIEQKTWDLENYGTTKEQYNKKTKIDKINIDYSKEDILR